MEFDGESAPGVLAHSGVVPSELIETICVRWKAKLQGQQLTKRVFVSTGLGTGLWNALPGSGLGLLVAGDFTSREQSRPFLEAILLFYEHFAQRDRSKFSIEAPSTCLDLSYPPGYVLGDSKAARRLHQEVRVAAAGDLPVLILGETGVGKELIARTLHKTSGRREGLFVAVNCAAIPADLLEAELFGIGAGVATGVSARKGQFELANGGTLFLDEIGEMPPAFQAKLLRVLEDRTLHPLGRKPRRIDIQLLAATNAQIEESMQAGSFRSDLYFRLAGYELRVPPLRERPEDIAALVEAFLTQGSREARKGIRGLTMEALELLMAYSWPGNVRELHLETRRLVQRCSNGQIITQDMLSDAITRCDEGPDSLPDPPGLPILNLKALESTAVSVAMQESRDNHSEAAALLGISRFSLRRRLAKLDS